MSAPLDDPLLQGRVAVSLITQKLGTALEEMAVKLESLRVHSDRIDAVRAHSEALEHDVEQLMERRSRLDTLEVTVSRIQSLDLNTLRNRATRLEESVAKIEERDLASLSARMAKLEELPDSWSPEQVTLLETMRAEVACEYARQHDVASLLGRVTKLEQCAEPASAASLLAAINDLAAKVERIETRAQRDVGSHAQRAYEAFCVSSRHEAIPWETISPGKRIAWMAAARAARAAD